MRAGAAFLFPFLVVPQARRSGSRSTRFFYAALLERAP